MTLKDLQAAIIEKKYSNVPVHARPAVKLSDAGANELTKAILAFFDYKGIKAWRQSSDGRYLKGKEYTDWMGRKREEKGKYIPRSKAAVGIGDIAFIGESGRFGSIEVKFGKDRQREEQKIFQAEVETSGAIYFIAKSWPDFYEQIKQYVK